MKRGGVCIYYKWHIPLTKQDDICILDNCLVTEMKKLLFAQLSQEILKLVVQIGGKMLLPTQYARNLNSLTSSAGYSQIIDKPTHIVNSSMPCINLIFCTDKNVISKHGVDVSVFEKCHHNIIFGKIAHPSNQLMSAKYGITARQMLKISKKQ